MTHEEATLLTKTALATSLKSFMKKKPLSKITISEIIEDCNVNRKTFYYHFENIYALLTWMLEQEAVQVVKNFDLMTNAEQAIIFVMDYIESNAHILNCAYDSLGREELKRFLYHDFYEITLNFIHNAEKKYELSVSADFEDFLCQLYMESLASMLIDWFRNPNHRSRETTISYLTHTFYCSLPEVLKHAPSEKKNACASSGVFCFSYFISYTYRSLLRKIFQASLHLYTASGSLPSS